MVTWYGRAPAPIVINQCIYCGKTPDSDEHVIPYSWLGDFELKNASCGRCRKIINEEFEGYCNGTLFGTLRKVQKFRSSRKHNKNKQIGMELLVTRNGKIEKIKVPPDSYPLLPFYMPQLPGAGIFIGMEPTNNLQAVFMRSYAPDVKDVEERIQKLREIGVTEFHIKPIDWNYALPRFARFLAKMAHGIAVMNLGMKGFTHHLPKYILGDDDKIFYVVGLSPEAIPVPSVEERPAGHDRPTVIYNVGTLVPGFGKFSGKEFVVVKIHLFPYFEGTPVYEVVVGEPIKTQDKE